MIDTSHLRVKSLIIRKSIFNEVVMRIVIVGGGAGGLELATSLGNKFGKKGKLHITLVDANITHLWKPLLHEVATGALDTGIDEINYRAHGKQHGFHFQIGRMCALNKAQKHIELEAILDEHQQELVPKRLCEYDVLIMATGSVTNDFGIKGVAEHCYFLDSSSQAVRFHKRLLNEFLRASTLDDDNHLLEVAIVGAGATGVELSAELHNTVDTLGSFGLEKITGKNLKVSIIEAGESILPALPNKISSLVSHELTKIGVSILTQTKIVEATETGFITAEGTLIPARLKIWSAGVKAANFMATLGLKTNHNNQLIVNKHLQTEDPSIFALGDCACFIQENGKPIAPRAQAAHQQATHLFTLIKAKLNNKPLPEFIYKDKGSLVSLSGYSTVGSLMGNLSKGSMLIEGKLARLVYISLYRLHQIALHGYWRTLLMSISGHINKVIRPKLKLH